MLGDLLPRFDPSGAGSAVGFVATPTLDIRVETIRQHQGQLVLVRRLENRGSVWRIRGQTLSHVKSNPVFIEISDECRVLRELAGRPSEMVARLASVGASKWRASTVIPLKQTQTFEGRSDEISELLDWWNDTDSRACLVYGDGGIGKTTLVLEFLNDLLDSPPETLSWMPELLFYYSAKLTRWGVSGLETIGGVGANVNEAIRSLARVLESPLTRDWHTEDSRSLIARAATLFQSAGLNRDSILLVIDNTETLARTTTGETDLGKVLRELSKKVGKLLVTSRRRERFEATQIPVPPMTEDVGALLLEKLAATYDAKAIQQAGPAKRRKVTRDFGGKPILLDVLARHIANTSCGIDEGSSAILSQERGDLGAFLFEDAWNRMEQSYRDVFLAIAQLGGSIGEQMLNWACAEFSCYGPNWLTAFEETRFGSLVDYGPYFDISLDSGAREFLSAKFAALDGSGRHRITTAAGHIRKKHFQATAAAEEKVSDRVAAAFRTNAAKAAKLAGNRRDVEGAIRWYEEATLVDPANAALFDRFAWYLMVNDRLEKAASVAGKAVGLDPLDADAWFTSGMIAARRSDVDAADGALESARRFGKPDYLVDLQRARARLEQAVSLKHSEPEVALSLAIEATRLLHGAVPGDPLRYSKHEQEREKLQRRVQGLIETIRPVRTLAPVRS